MSPGWALPTGTIFPFLANHLSPASQEANPYLVWAATVATNPAWSKHQDTNIAHQGL